MHYSRREQDLILKVVDQITIVYDGKCHKAFSLNETASMVFRRCDGKTSREQIIQYLSGRYRVSTEEATALMDLALEQLSQRGLLAENIHPAAGEERISRRQMIQRLAQAAVVVPVIIGLTAPSPVDALSLRPNGSACLDDLDCASGFCDGGVCADRGMLIPLDGDEDF